MLRSPFQCSMGKRYDPKDAGDDPSFSESSRLRVSIGEVQRQTTDLLECHLSQPMTLTSHQVTDDGSLVESRPSSCISPDKYGRTISCEEEGTTDMKSLFLNKDRAGPSGSTGQKRPCFDALQQDSGEKATKKLKAAPDAASNANLGPSTFPAASAGDGNTSVSCRQPASDMSLDTADYILTNHENSRKRGAGGAGVLNDNGEQLTTAEAQGKKTTSPATTPQQRQEDGDPLQWQAQPNQVGTSTRQQNLSANGNPESQGNSTQHLSYVCVPQVENGVYYIDVVPLSLLGDEQDEILCLPGNDDLCRDPNTGCYF